MARSPTPSDRLNEIRRLHRLGPDGLPALREALSDPCITVRTEAARVLGLIGGAEEAARLSAALSNAIGRRSPGWHRVLGWLAVVGLGSLVAVMIVLIGVLSFGQAFKLTDIKPWEIWRSIVGAQRGEEPFIGACVEALAAISERDPWPGRRELIGEFRALATDETHLTRSTRAKIAGAAERLDLATRELTGLPTPAAAPTPTAESLPVETATRIVTLGNE